MSLRPLHLGALRDRRPVPLIDRNGSCRPGAGPDVALATMCVRPDERGAGVGAALVTTLHRELDRAGVAVTLLHHGQLNPLSSPFWNRMGYRPL
jgi:predicted N-acetyltransferase YhbS